MNVNAGDPRRSNGAQQYVLGANGKPLTDRYGRPIRKRPATGVPLERHGSANLPPARPPKQSPPPVQQRPPRREAGRPQPGYQPGYQPNYPEGRPQSHPQGRPQPGYQPGRLDPAHRPAGYHQPAAAAPVPPRARRHNRRGGCARSFGCLGLILMTIVVMVLVFTLWSDTKLTRSDALDYPHVANTPGTNWLLVGSDSRQGLSEEEQNRLGTGGDVGVGRTDTIMLLHIPRRGPAKLVSIPRDSYVEIPGFGMDKINAAFAFGGAPLLGQTIEQWSGVRIDRYAEIGMGGLANVVDSVGGVDICVAEPIQDELAGIDLPAGCQELKGHNALGYVRTRATAMGDLDRVARQREFFSALLDRVTSPGTLLNPFRVVSLVNHTAKSFVVGQSDHVWNLARLAWVMSQDVEKVTVPVEGFADTAVGNVVLWNDAETAALWESLKN